MLLADIPHCSPATLGTSLDPLDFSSHSFKLHSFRFERNSIHYSDYLWLDHFSCWINLYGYTRDYQVDR